MNIYVCRFGADHPEIQPQLIEDLRTAIRADRRRKLGEIQSMLALIAPTSELRPLIDSILLDDSDLAC